MIPILYEKDETAFTNNGLGRLRDAISVIVSEERNSIYELDFDYPVNGANYELIQVGRIVGVTHDDTGDIQPYDIVSFTKPIDGVVSFHCTHISYRLSYSTIRADISINSLSAAFTHIKKYATPAIPFTFDTDKTSTGFCSALRSAPNTVRQVLGGVEGSVLDAYGGEYEWDKWNVKLWSARGQLRDFTIRYGVNMLDYNEEYDSTGCYSSCRPYWTDGTNTVVGDKQVSGGITPSGREQCIPLDVSDKFETKPTKAQVEAMGLSVMNSQNPTMPSQNISVSFVRLQDMGEYDTYQTLLKCQLCDTINVIFPDFNSGGRFKIVKTEWNVLTGKYESMELGSLSISLSDALGITNTLDRALQLDDLPQIRTGAIGATTVSANSYTDVHVTFSPAMTATPMVVASITSTSTAGAIGSISVAVNERSATGFTARIFNAGSTGRTPGVTWFAIL